MIPADVASRQQVSADAALRPVAPAQEIADKLSGLVAGSKVMAVIQSMLPNGTYRAMINQRSITLALPFSAKSGDALELLVTESDGKLALAVVARQEGEGGKTAASTTATLSRTGQLISTLFSSAREAKGGTQPVPLNGNQPIAGTPPGNAQDLLPLLKQAITQSGLFYESHQAGWVEGRFPKGALLQEPQGKLSHPSAFVATDNAPDAESAQIAPLKPFASSAEAAVTRPAIETPATTASNETGKTAPAQIQGTLIAQQTQGLVQQQLQALATQVFSWHGQVWPGQEMQWEIDEEAARNGNEGDDSAARWNSRLRLTLPNLGEIDALIRLQGDQVTLSVSAGNAGTREQMRTESLSLRSQLGEAGLTLASMGIDTLAERPTDVRE